MKRSLTFLAAPLAVAFLAMPVLAQDATTPDVATMTCADYMKLDATAQMTATREASKVAAMSDEDAAKAAAMTADEKTKAMTDEQTKMDAMTDDQKAENKTKMADAQAKLITACTGNDSMTVLEAMKTASK